VKVLVFGGYGQLGSDLAVVAGERGHELVRPRHGEVDITDRDAVLHSAREHRPHVIITTAAFHKMDQTEADPVQTFAVNTVGARYVAEAARSAGARCVYISTDYVFDGEQAHGYTEDDPVNPVNLYGVSKAAGEFAVRNSAPDSLVVRGSGLFGHAGSSGKGGNLVETMLAKAEAGEPIQVVDDQFAAPTCTRDMAGRILLWLENRVPAGVYHGANRGGTSWYQFCRRIFELAGLQPDLTPKSAGVQEVRRPRSSILIDTRSERLGLPPNRHWEEGLAWYLENRPARRAAEAPAPVPAGQRGSAR
jgi:dTDP-4-dehydrorhamnose reductase